MIIFKIIEWNCSAMLLTAFSSGAIQKWNGSSSVYSIVQEEPFQIGQ